MNNDWLKGDAYYEGLKAILILGLIIIAHYIVGLILLCKYGSIPIEERPEWLRLLCNI